MTVLNKIQKHSSPALARGGVHLRAVKSSWPKYEPDEIAIVTDVLQSGRVNALVHGDHNAAFESEFANYVNMPYAIAVANGTVSIEMALRALGVGTGDEVIIPARSFFATASAVVAVGADPVFADVDVQTQNIDPDSVLRMISERTKAVICVHLAGRPCNMEALVKICKSHALFLIEDCAQAHGATFDDKPVGSFGDASSFSFCTDKIMSTGGEGGMVLFADKLVWAKAWAIKDHGKLPPEQSTASNAPSGEFRYLHHSFGSNYRMTEMQAAIGRMQLAKLSKWVAQRRANATCLSQAISGLPGIIVSGDDPRAKSSFYKFYVRVDEGKTPRNKTRLEIISGLMRLGIQCGSGSCPDMSKEVAFRDRAPRRDGKLENANMLGAATIMFPVDHLLGRQDMLAIADALQWVLME